MGRGLPIATPRVTPPPSGPGGSPFDANEVSDAYDRLAKSTFHSQGMSLLTKSILYFFPALEKSVLGRFSLIILQIGNRT